MKRSQKTSLAVITFGILFMTSCGLDWSNQNATEVPQYSDDPNLIKDCPEKIIQNNFPGPNCCPRYYIYRGYRLPTSYFDKEWVKYNCGSIPIETVH